MHDLIFFFNFSQLFKSNLGSLKPNALEAFMLIRVWMEYVKPSCILGHAYYMAFA